MSGSAVADVWRRLLLQVGRGSVDAFATLYDELAPAVFTASRRALAGPDEAAEATGDAFVMVWQDAPTFDPRDHDAVGWVVLRVSMAIQRHRAGLPSDPTVAAALSDLHRGRDRVDRVEDAPGSTAHAGSSSAG